MHNMFMIKMEVFVEHCSLGNMKGMIFADQQINYETMPLRYGIDLRTEYQYTKALSFFAMFDNVAFQRYFYWNNYPSQKFRLLLGLTYTIPTL